MALCTPPRLWPCEVHACDPVHPAPRRGYQHFGGRGQRGFAVVYSQEGRKRALRWVAVLGAGGAVVWVSSRQEVPYTARM